MSRKRIGPAFPWSSQVVQYERVGPPDAIIYVAGAVAPGKVVDCLLYYGPNGRLAGILNHYPVDMPPHEVKGSVNIWIDPECQRQGIGTRLLDAARARWTVDLDRQRYTDQGARFIVRYEARPGRRARQAAVGS